MIHPVSRRWKYFRYMCMHLKQKLFILCELYCVCLFASGYLCMKIYVYVSLPALENMHKFVGTHTHPYTG